MLCFMCMRAGEYWHKIDGIYACAFKEQTKCSRVVMLISFHLSIYLLFPASNWYINTPFVVDTQRKTILNEQSARVRSPRIAADERTRNAIKYKSDRIYRLQNNIRLSVHAKIKDWKKTQYSRKQRVSKEAKVVILGHFVNKAKCPTMADFGGEFQTTRIVSDGSLMKPYVLCEKRLDEPRQGTLIETVGYPKVAQVVFLGIFQKTQQNYVGCKNLL